MLQLNLTILHQVVNDAKQRAADSPRWLTAIDKAAAQLLDNPYIEALDDHTLLIAGTSGIYTANGVCQCQAFQHHQPCVHRAMAKLYQRYTEAQAAQQAQAERLNSEQCPNCCADRAYADRCPLAQSTADQAERQARWAKAQAEIEECFS